MHKNEINIEKGRKNQTFLFSYFNPRHNKKIEIKEKMYEW